MYLYSKVNLHILCSIDTHDHDLVLYKMHGTAYINIVLNIRALPLHNMVITSVPLYCMDLEPSIQFMLLKVDKVKDHTTTNP